MEMNQEEMKLIEKAKERNHEFVQEFFDNYIDVED